VHNAAGMLSSAVTNRVTAGLSPKHPALYEFFILTCESTQLLPSVTRSSARLSELFPRRALASSAALATTSATVALSLHLPTLNTSKMRLQPLTGLLLVSKLVFQCVRQKCSKTSPQQAMLEGG
jgi:hypothetical protein